MQQLGLTLVSDDFSALSELIKNSYDADSTLVNLVIDAPHSIVISDNGDGMTESDVIRGWLTVSNSLKYEQKQRKELTKGQRRTPLGDKGVGRLSSQRLASLMSLETVAKGTKRKLTVKIDWNKFKPGQKIEDVLVDIEDEDTDATPGTELILTELRDPEFWSRLSKSELRLKLASLVSPYKDISSFRLRAFINGEEASPDLITDNIRAAAWQTFQISFDGEYLEVKGQIKLQTFGGTTTAARDDFRNYASHDRGDSFLAYLLNQKEAKQFGVQGSSSEGHFVNFAFKRPFREIQGKLAVKNPGPFHGEVDSFSLESSGTEDILKGTSALSSSSDARALVKELSGIKVFRDGFLVKTDHDWLKLGEGQTSGGSFYGLRPFNTMGYIAISAEHNGVLEETTDRESFVDNEYYFGFYAILTEFRIRTGRLLEFLRRGWLAYVKTEKKKQLDAVSLSTSAIEDRITDAFDQTQAASEQLGEAVNALTQLTSSQSSLFVDEGTKHQINLVKDLVEQSKNTLETVSVQRGLTDFLTEEVRHLEQRLGEVYELVGLGITAEAISHDINNLLDRLRDETNNTLTRLRSIQSEDSKLFAYLHMVRDSISGLESQLSHLDPALKYVRDKVETFKVQSFINDCSIYYRKRLDANNISLELSTSKDFTIKMNKGKLVQVLDNLVLNSEYWLLQSNLETRYIRISINKPSLTVEDNGPGINEMFEDTLFDPFVTGKPRHEGRGLGLFIATQLLSTTGCTLRLMPEVNRNGRKFRFEIQLGGVLA